MKLSEAIELLEDIKADYERWNDGKDELRLKALQMAIRLMKWLKIKNGKREG